MADARLVPAPADGVLPDGFFVTSNRRTWVSIGGRWIPVERQRMDCCIVVEEGKAYCLEPRRVRRGMLVVVGEEGVREKGGMEFMSSQVSPERPAWLAAKQLAEEMVEVRRRGGRIFFVVGPAVIHSGGREALASVVRKGFVDLLIAGNGFAVHDMEASIYGTSLGRSLRDGRYVHHATHIWTINRVNAAGSIKAAVESGLVKDGVMYECVRRGVRYILVGSIRDDGPLKDTVTDMVVAQDMIREEIARGVDIAVVLATMLLGIGVGNMLPYDTRLVAVDINPAVVSKLYDRGSQQVTGVVTDVGLFLKELNHLLPENSA